MSALASTYSQTLTMYFKEIKDSQESQSVLYPKGTFRSMAVFRHAVKSLAICFLIDPVCYHKCALHLQYNGHEEPRRSRAIHALEQQAGKHADRHDESCSGAKQIIRPLD